MLLRPRIYTVGHSSMTLQEFLNLLRTHEITAIADVRSIPYSRYTPQFNTDTLSHLLRKNGIKYAFLGEELGARPKNKDCYIGNVVSYEKLSQTAAFKKGIQRVENGCTRFNIALMCSEKDPIECHRTILVSKILEERGAEIVHICGNDELEVHRKTMLRVMDLFKMPRGDLVNTIDDFISLAYVKREKQIAFKK